MKLRGFCALSNEVKKHSEIVASWRTGKRLKEAKITIDLFKNAKINVKLLAKIDIPRSFYSSATN